MTMPEDLTNALAEVSSAKALWESLNKNEEYPASWKIETASETARVNRLAAVMQMLAAVQFPELYAQTKCQRPKGEPMSPSALGSGPKRSAGCISAELDS
jgi:hypothetical protein